MFVPYDVGSNYVYTRRISRALAEHNGHTALFGDRRPIAAAHDEHRQICIHDITTWLDAASKHTTHSIRIRSTYAIIDEWLIPANASRLGDDFSSDDNTDEADDGVVKEAEESSIVREDKVGEEGTLVTGDGVLLPLFFFDFFFLLPPLLLAAAITAGGVVGASVVVLVELFVVLSSDGGGVGGDANATAITFSALVNRCWWVFAAVIIVFQSSTEYPNDLNIYFDHCIHMREIKVRERATEANLDMLCISDG
jgi:hypothetical protein